MSGRERGKVGEAHLGSGCGGGGGEQGELSLFLKQKKNIYKGGERGGWRERRGEVREGRTAVLEYGVGGSRAHPALKSGSDGGEGSYGCEQVGAADERSLDKPRRKVTDSDIRRKIRDSCDVLRRKRTWSQQLGL